MKKIFLSALVFPLLITGCQTQPSTENQQASKNDMIVVESPTINQTVSSPLIVRGEARGTWFFEGSFPVILEDANGNQLAMAVATSSESWMTEEYIPFQATLTFEDPETPTGALVLEKENPSGLPQNANQLEVPVKF